MEYSIPMSELRKRSGDFFNRVIQERPAVVTRHSNAIIALSESHFNEIVKHLKLTINIESEDGVYTVDIPELALLTWGNDFEEAKESLVDQAKDYAKDYLERFNLFFHAPNRKSHFPYIFRILLCENKDQVRELFSA